MKFSQIRVGERFKLNEGVTATDGSKHRKGAIYTRTGQHTFEKTAEGENYALDADPEVEAVG